MRWNPLRLATVLQALSLSQALQTTIASPRSNASDPEGPDGPVTNQTDALTPQLSSNCSGTLGLVLGTTWIAVSLTPQSPNEVANQICKRLGCAEMYSFSHSGAHNSTCLTNCTYSDFQLKNCTEVPQNNCSNVTTIVCGSLEAQDTTVVTLTTGPATTPVRARDSPPALTPAEVGCVTLSLLLLMALVMNALLCWRHRKRERGAPREQNKGNRQTSTERQDNSYQSNDEVRNVTADVAGRQAPHNPRQLCAQRSVDSFSVDSDYEPFDLSATPAVALATFDNSLCNRAENVSPTLKPWSLYCLTEEGDDPALPGHRKNVGGFRTLGERQTNRTWETKDLAIPAVDSFDSSSTSSGEDYENTGMVAELQIQGDALPAKMTEGVPFFQPQTGKYHPQLGDSSSTSSGEDYDIPEGVEEPLCPAAIEDSNPSSSDSDYDDVVN